MGKKRATTAETANTQPAESSQAEVSSALRRKNRRRHLRALRDLVIRIALLLLVVYILFFHLVGITVMRSGDMHPRIDLGDLVLYYRLENNYHAQDVIVFEKPTASLDESYKETRAVEAAETVSKPWWRQALDWIGFRDPNEPDKTMFICRIVAGPGDTVEISNEERLIVNGNTMIEPDIFYPTNGYIGYMEYPVTLKEGEYFVLADHRSGGADSRFFGAVNKNEILGSVITILRRNNL